MTLLFIDMKKLSKIELLCKWYQVSEKEMAEMIGVTHRTLNRYLLDEENIPSALYLLLEEWLELAKTLHQLTPQGISFYSLKCAGYSEEVNAIKILRERMGLDHTKFAAYLGLSLTTIVHYEDGKIPLHIHKIAKLIIDLKSEIDYQILK